MPNTIIDSHCHAWPRWPYQPPVPDDTERGKIEQLIFEMDQNGVSEAVVVCAQIERNPDNNEYIARQAERFPARLHPFPDIDCSWSPTYHQPGAADRFRRITDQWPRIKGFTHYLKADDDGAWLTSPEGLAFFKVAADKGLIASIALRPGQQAAIRALAERFPSMPILCHHLSGLKTSDSAGTLQGVLQSAKLPNIYIKLSGFAYCTKVNWDFPYTDTHPTVRALYETFGADRMCWGSDYPVVRFYMTYKHALEAFRTHCDFVSAGDKGKILGETMTRLLKTAGQKG